MVNCWINAGCQKKYPLSAFIHLSAGFFLQQKGALTPLQQREKMQKQKELTFHSTLVNHSQNNRLTRRVKKKKFIPF